MIIIGITGTPGSGKGTVVEYLIKKHNFKHYSARQFISEEVAKKDWPQTRENMRTVANELRSVHGPNYIAEQLYNKAKAGGGNAVIESLRNPQEILTLRSKPEKFFMIAIDANPQVRYERILKRKSSTDDVSLEKFMADEQAEMNDPDPNGIKLVECMGLADATIMNNYDIPTLQLEVDNVLEPLL